MEDKSFKILSIDGGGIRGVFPAMFLANLEKELEARGQEKYKIYQHFDLICGTSTGGIIAIALALGIPALDIYKLYIEKASEIFGLKKSFVKRLLYSAHDRTILEQLIRNKFKEAKDNQDPILKDCKTNICIPVYDLMQGKPCILKNNYHANFVRDYHIPAYQAALATSSAPTYFDPYSTRYTDLKGVEQTFNNKVDGGVFANNPTLLGIVEAQKAFGVNLTNLKVLSLGTGHQRFADACSRKKWGLHYWMTQKNKKRIIELFIQGQSQQVQNIVSLLLKGIDRQETDNFVYNRIDTDLDETCLIEMDETNKYKLEKLAEKAHIEFQNHASTIISQYCS
jgi:patatin-like phospholipase/acyl hydrolase